MSTLATNASERLSDEYSRWWRRLLLQPVVRKFDIEVGRNGWPCREEGRTPPPSIMQRCQERQSPCQELVSTAEHAAETFHPWKHCSGGLAAFEANNDTWHMCMCSLGFLDVNLGRHKNVIKPPKQMILFNYFELMDVVLVTWQTFSQSMKERQLEGCPGCQSRCMWVARKRVGNANGGSEFDFRLADGGRGWTMVRRFLPTRPQLPASGNKHSPPIWE